MKPVDPDELKPSIALDPHTWMGLVLDHFARGEQALGQLSLSLGLCVSNGSLGSLNELRNRLRNSDNRKAKLLDKRIERWSQNRPFRHLLAHATITTLFDAGGGAFVITRHLPRDQNDVTPDRMWSEDDRKKLLRQASSDSRSIADHVRNLLADPLAMQTLGKT